MTYDKLPLAGKIFHPLLLPISGKSLGEEDELNFAVLGLVRARGIQPLDLDLRRLQEVDKLRMPVAKYLHTRLELQRKGVRAGLLIVGSDMMRPQKTDSVVKIQISPCKLLGLDLRRLDDALARVVRDQQVQMRQSVMIPLGVSLHLVAELIYLWSQKSGLRSHLQ